MLVIGLTGSIATGKSTASRALAAPPLSLPVIDADELARAVVAPGTPGYAAIVARFGPSTPDLLQAASTTMPETGPDGRGRPLDRAALGRRVFGTDATRAADRAALNRIVHPAVRRAMVRRVLGAYVRGCWAVVLDVPLLFESGLDVFCGAVLVVGMRDGAAQLKRLLARDRAQGGRMTESEAQGRIASQESVERKCARLAARGGGAGQGAEIWNDGAQAELAPKLRAYVLGPLRRSSPRWWHGVLWACPPLALLAAAWSMYWAAKARKRYEAMQAEDKGKQAKL